MRSYQVPLLAALLVAGCGTPGYAPDDTPSSPPKPPPDPALVSPPTTIAPAPAHEGMETGLCTAWSSQVVDFSSLGPTQGKAYFQPFWAHGSSGGFSVVTTPTGDGIDTSRVAALAVDRTGAPRGAEVDLPLDPGAGVDDVIATPDGGWLAMWTVPNANDSSGSTYFIRYDGSGVPLKRSNSLTSSACAVLGQDPGGGEDVAFCTGTDPQYGNATGWAMGQVTVDGASFTSGPSFGATHEAPLLFRQGTLLSTNATARGRGTSPRTSCST